MRCSGKGTRLPPRERSTASERLAFQRQRAVKSGEPRKAWASTSSIVLAERKRRIDSSGKVWGLPSESTMASSFAAA